MARLQTGVYYRLLFMAGVQDVIQWSILVTLTLIASHMQTPVALLQVPRTIPAD